MSVPKAPFESMRQLLQQATEQLATELEGQPQTYPMAGDVLALLDETAREEGLSVWQVWSCWGTRHRLPIRTLVQSSRQRDLTADETTAMRARLMDALGYCILGLAICERSDP